MFTSAKKWHVIANYGIKMLTPVKNCALQSLYRPEKGAESEKEMLLSNRSYGQGVVLLITTLFVEPPRPNRFCAPYLCCTTLQLQGQTVLQQYQALIGDNGSVMGEKS